MESASAYMPADRRAALAGGAAVPEYATGAALFADIAGFTPLTEALALALGPRRGAEELARQINLVYDTLIALVDAYGGSVISFSGDAITCWFANQMQKAEGRRQAEGQAVQHSAASLRALTCALALQRAMAAFAALPLPGGSAAALTLKVAVASGAARRLVVGEAAVQLLDALAGATVARLAQAEHLAGRGEVLADVATVEALAGAGVQLAAWRHDGAERFAVVAGVRAAAEAAPWPALAPEALGDDETRPWLLPAVHERLRDGLGEFLTELRPAVALFLRFGGIDYDGDAAAGAQLDAFVRRVQAIVAGYGGALLQLTIGDKGSYLYAAFGAPVAHEDDVRRAVLAALALQALPGELTFIQPVQIGISRGTMRTGAYGGATRRTYGALGDEVNLAARLMQHAAPGEVLASGRVHSAVAALFGWQPLPAIRMKGKAQPVPLARLVSAQPQPAAPGSFAGALVGRDAELEALGRFVAPIFAGRFAGVASVYGEAGMGKSRLVHELRARLTGGDDWPLIGAGLRPQIAADQTKQDSDPRASASEAQRKSAANRPPVSWHTLPADELLGESLGPVRRWLRAHFAQRPADAAQNQARFDAALDALASGLGAEASAELRGELERTRSFLAALVDLRTEGSLYEQLDPKLRFENTLAAVKALVLAESLNQPVVLHVEDAHWLDDDTRALLALLARNVDAYPCALLLTSRYADDGTAPPPPVDADAPQLAVNLAALSEGSVCLVAAQALGGDVADDLAALLAAKTGGNPFFAEQLALDLRERGALILEHSAWSIQHSAFSEVPENITAVLVARLDRLAAQVRAVVQTAAVLGQEFEVRVLSQMLRGDERLPERVRQAESAAIWTALSEIRYLFRHALLRDAAYDMQLHERLRALHALAGAALEQVYADDLAPHAAALAYHYARAEQPAKERAYSRLAGERAAAQYANAAAAQFFGRALELTPADDLAERYALLLAHEHVEDMQASREVQRADLSALATLAEQLDDDARRVEVALRQARYAHVVSDYAGMIASAQEATGLAQATSNTKGEAEGLLQLTRALWYQGAYEGARLQAIEALRLAQVMGLISLEADSFRALGNVAVDQGNYAQAQADYGQGLQIHRKLGDWQGESYALNNLGTVAFYRGLYARARLLYEESLAIKRRTGDRFGQSLALLNLGEAAAAQGDYSGARYYYEQALRLKEEMSASSGASLVLSNLGDVAGAQGDFAAAQAYFERALSISQEIGHRQQESWVLARLALLLHQRQAHQAAQQRAEQAVALARQINDRNTQGYALTSLGHALHNIGQLDAAASSYREALELRRVLEQPVQALEPLAGIARVALASNDLTQALSHIEPIVQHLAQGTLDGTDEPFRIHLTVYQVLHAANDPRAHGVLERAHALLQERAAKLDEATRQSFLEQVPHHRELVAAWAALLRNEAP